MTLPNDLLETLKKTVNAKKIRHGLSSWPLKAKSDSIFHPYKIRECFINPLFYDMLSLQV